MLDRRQFLLGAAPTIGGAFALLRFKRPALMGAGAAAASMPADHRALYNAGSAFRARTEFNPSFSSAVHLRCRWGDLNKTLQSLSPNRFYQLDIIDTGIASIPIQLSSKDMGTGGVYVNGRGLQVDAPVTIQHVHGIKFDNIDFVTAGDYEGSRFAINMQTPLGRGSSARGRVVRFGPSTRFGRLFKSGQTEVNWREFTNAISCFHAEKLILDGCQFSGIVFHAGFHAVDLGIIANCTSTEFVRVLYSGSPEYYLGETKASIFGEDRYLFIENSHAFAQWDRMPLYSSAGYNSDVPHVDYFQTQPSDSFGWSAGARPPIGTKFVSNETGQIYRVTALGPGVTAHPPSHRSGKQTYPDDYEYEFVGMDARPAYRLFLIGNYAIERGITGHPNPTHVTDRPLSGAHTQLAFWRDSCTNKADLNARFVLMATGNVSAASSQAGWEVGEKAKTEIYAAFNSFSGPVRPADISNPNNMVDPACNSAGTGTLRSFHDIIGNGFGPGPLSVVGNYPVSCKATARKGTRPGDLFQGRFERDSNGNWKLNDADASVLLNASTGREDFIRAVGAVFNPKDAVSAGARFERES